MLPDRYLAVFNISLSGYEINRNSLSIECHGGEEQTCCYTGSKWEAEHGFAFGILRELDIAHGSLDAFVPYVF